MYERNPGVPYEFGRKMLKEVRTPQEYPAGACYVIQFFEKGGYTVPGDERSRQCPGHGYPEHYVETLTVRQFVTQDEAEWHRAIEFAYSKAKDRTDVVAFVMEKADVQTSVQVQVKKISPR